MPTDTPQPTATAVAVWDLPVRLFHWTLVVLVSLLIVTGLNGGDALQWHMWFGQALLALLLFRVVWGFAGSVNARFRSFVRGPGAVLAYARSLVVPPHAAHPTHNPLGGWMVILLLVALLVQATTGLFTNDDILWDGPLAQRVTQETSNAMSWFHRRFWWVVVTLVLAHIAAVIAYLVVLDENLVWPMMSGEKTLPPGVARPEHAAASLGRAAVIAAASGLVVWGLLALAR
jgi:cytochrome b